MAFCIVGDIDEKKIEMSSAIKHLPFIQTLTNVMVVAIENKNYIKLSLQKQPFKKELELAQSMQKLLFPSLPNIEGIRNECFCIYLTNKLEVITMM